MNDKEKLIKIKELLESDLKEACNQACSCCDSSYNVQLYCQDILKKFLEIYNEEDDEINKSIGG